MALPLPIAPMLSSAISNPNITAVLCLDIFTKCKRYLSLCKIYFTFVKNTICLKNYYCPTTIKKLVGVF